MNSAQRRQAKREFQHVVLLKPDTGERYFQHDGQVSVARAWCKRQIHKGSWQCKARWDHAEFRFSNEKDATFFALKWA